MTVCVRRSGVAFPLDQRETVAGETRTMLAISFPWRPPSSRRRSSVLLTAVAMSGSVFLDVFSCSPATRTRERVPSVAFSGPQTAPNDIAPVREHRHDCSLISRCQAPEIDLQPGVIDRLALADV